MKKSLVALSILTGLSAHVHGAVYQVEELSTLDIAKHHYVTDANNNGEVIGQARGVYNLPIDVSYIDFRDSQITNAYDDWERSQFEAIDKEITFTLDDIEAGNLNADAHRFMLSFLSTSSVNSDANWQKIADSVAVNFTPSPATEQVLLDQQSDHYDGLTRSVANLYNAISEDGVRAGWSSAPYEQIEFTPSGDDEAQTYFVRDFRSRGVVVGVDGTVVTLPVISDLYGGQGTANDIVMRPDGGYYVVGDSSTGVPEDRQENYDDRCDGEDEPVAVCVWEIENRSASNTRNGLYDRRATLWTLDADLNVVDTKNLGLGLSIEEDENSAFVSTALAVNAQGIAVGYSHIRDNNNDNRINTLPALFKDGEVLEIIDQEDDWYSGKATAITDNGIVTGYATKNIEGRRTTKFFYHNIETGTTVFPTDYFTSSSSVGRDINEQGVIVGEGEVDVVNSGSRRREGFIYTLGDDKIANINDLLPCYDVDGESNYPYTFAEATAIDDDNIIYGVATKTEPKLNSFGEVEVDSDGETLYESVAKPVKLTPIAGGEVEECPPEAAETYERQSGSLGWLALLALPLLGWRRKHG